MTIILNHTSDVYCSPNFWIIFWQIAQTLVPKKTFMYISLFWSLAYSSIKWKLRSGREERENDVGTGPGEKRREEIAAKMGWVVSYLTLGSDSLLIAPVCTFLPILSNYSNISNKRVCLLTFQLSWKSDLFPCTRFPRKMSG